MAFKLPTPLTICLNEWSMSKALSRSSKSCNLQLAFCPLTVEQTCQVSECLTQLQKLRRRDPNASEILAVEQILMEPSVFTLKSPTVKVTL